MKKERESGFYFDQLTSISIIFDLILIGRGLVQTSLDHFRVADDRLQKTKVSVT